MYLERVMVIRRENSLLTYTDQVGWQTHGLGYIVVICPAEFGASLDEVEEL